MLVATIRNFNESVLLDYTDRAGDFLLTTIDKVETSPMLEQLISQIEAHIPDEEQADRFITDLLQYVDLDQLAGVLEKAEAGVGYLDYLGELLGRVPNMSGYVDMLSGMRPDIAKTVDGHLDDIGGHLGEGLDTAEQWVNKTNNLDLEEQAKGLQDALKGHLNSSQTIVQLDGINLKTESSTADYSDLITTKDQQKPTHSSPYSRLQRKTTSEGPHTVKTREAFSTPPTPIESTHDNSTYTTNALRSIMHNASALAEAYLPNIEVNETSKIRHEAEGAVQKGVKEADEKVQETVDHLQKGGEQVVKDIHEGAQLAAGQVSDQLGQAANAAGDLAEDAQEVAQQIIADARKMAGDAQTVARRAAEEAEVAVRRAEELVRAAAQEVDGFARAAAVAAAEKAKAAARIAKKAAADALKRAQAALSEVDDIIRAAGRGAISWARKAMTKLRYYAKTAFAWARKAVIEAKKGARVAVKYVGIAKREFLKGYEYVKEFYYKLKIERIGQDTFCSELKVILCQEVGAQSYTIRASGELEMLKAVCHS